MNKRNIIYKIISRIKLFIFRIRFRLKATAYMRVIYTQPRLVVLITARLGDKDNVLPIDWHVPLSFFPKLYAISLETKNYSCSMIKTAGSFAVNFMPGSFEEAIIACGKISGADADKFRLINLKKTEAKKINAPILTDSLGYIECKVIETRLVGDHTLFIADVLYEKMDITPEKLQLYHISRL